MRSFVLFALLVFMGSLSANPPCWGQDPFGPVGPAKAKPALCECDEKNGCPSADCKCNNPDCRGLCHKQKPDLLVSQKAEFPPTVLLRFDKWDAGASVQPFAKALRDKVPGYDPAKDPTPKGSGGNTDKKQIPTEWIWLAAILAGGGLIYWIKKNA
jgi:hypothetical protein